MELVEGRSKLDLWNTLLNTFMLFTNIIISVIKNISMSHAFLELCVRSLPKLSRCVFTILTDCDVVQHCGCKYLLMTTYL